MGDTVEVGLVVGLVGYTVDVGLVGVTLDVGLVVDCSGSQSQYISGIFEDRREDRGAATHGR